MPEEGAVPDSVTIPDDDNDSDHDKCVFWIALLYNGWTLFVYFIGWLIIRDRGMNDGGVFLSVMYFIPVVCGAFCYAANNNDRRVPFFMISVTVCWLSFNGVMLLLTRNYCGTQLYLQRKPVFRNASMDTLASFPPGNAVVSFPSDFVQPSVFGLAFTSNNSPVYAMFISSQVIFTANSQNVPMVVWATTTDLSDVLYRAIDDMRDRFPVAHNVSVPRVLSFFPYESALSSSKRDCDRSTTAFWVGFPVFNTLFGMARFCVMKYRYIYF